MDGMVLARSVGSGQVPPPAASLGRERLKLPTATHRTSRLLIYTLMRYRGRAKVSASSQSDPICPEWKSKGGVSVREKRSTRPRMMV